MGNGPATDPYKRPFEAILDGAVILDAATGRIMLANQAAASILGFVSPEEMVSLNPLDYVPGEDQKPVALLLAEGLEVDRPTPAEIRLRTKDGRLISVSATSALVEHEGKKSALITIREITSEKAKDANVREADHLYHTLFNSMIDGAVVLDATTARITLANKAAARVFGFASPEEMVGLNPLDFVPEEDQERVVALMAESFEKDREVPAEIRVRTKDGRLIWVSATGALIEHEGRKATLTTITDITADRAKDTALMEAEQRYENLFEGMMDGAVVLDISTFQIAYANKAAADMFGADSRRELIGENPLSYIPEDDRDDVARMIALHLEGQGQPAAEIRVVTKDKRTIWVSANATTIDYEGRTATLTTLRDITADKAKDAALLAAEEGKLRLIDAAAESIFIVQDGKVVYVNPAGAAAAGLTQEQMAGLSFLDFVHADQRQALEERHHRILAGHWPSEQITAKGVDASGQTRWAEIKEIPYTWKGRPAIMSLIFDITDKMRLEEERKEREERLRAVIENAWDGITILDENYSVIFESPSLARITGYTQEEWMGRPVGQMNIHPDDLSPLLARMEILKTQPGSVVTDVVVRYQHKDGSWRWLEATGHNLLHDPKVRGLVVNFRDVTDRVKADQLLKEQEVRFRTLIERAADVVIVLDATSKITYQSPSLERVTGFGHDEWVGRPLDQLLVHPDDLPLLAALLERLLTQPGATFEGITARYQHKDGSWHILEATVTNMLHDPKVAGIVANFRDITDRKEAEEKLRGSEDLYRSLVLISPDAVTVSDLKGCFTFVSPQTARLHGYDSTEELLGRSAFELTAPEDQAKAASALEAMFAQGFVRDVEATFLRKDGSRFIGELSAALIRDANGDPNSIVGYTRDITDRKAAQQALLESEQKFRLLVENSTDVIFSLDTQGNFTYVSPAIERISGYRVDEVVGTSFVRFVVPEDLPALMVSFERTLAGADEPSEFRAIVKDGSVRYARTTSRVTVRDGQVTGLTGIISDITDSKLAEQLVRESEEKFRNLAEHSPNMIFINVKGRVVYANRLCQEMMGYTQEEFLSPDFDFLAITAPEYRETVKQKFRAHMSGQDVPPYEYAIMTKDGRRLETILSSKLISYGAEKAILGTITDITARKEAEKALQTEKAFTDQALDTQIDTVFVFDPASGKAIRWNRSFCNISGYSDDEIAVLPAPISYYGPDDLERARAAQLRLAQGETVSMVMDLICKDGHKVTTEYTAAPMKDEKGDNRFVIAVGRDITDRKRAEENLRASEERNRLLIDNAAEVVTVVQDGLISFISRSCLDLSGYLPEELISKSFIELIHPDDRQMVAENYVKRLRGEPVPTGYSFRILDKSGDIRWAAASVTLFTWEGRPATLGLLTDVTERKKAEEALQGAKDYAENVIQTANVLFVALDRDGNVTQLNKAGEKITGYQQGEVLGKNWFELIVPKERYPKVWEAFEKVKAQGTIVDTFENPILTKSGEERIISWQNSTLVLNNQVVGTLSFGTDITERKRAESTLRESEERFRLLTEKTNDLIWMTDINLVTIYASPSAERLLGFSPQELLKIGTESLMTPESYARAQETLLKQLELEREARADPQRSVTLELEYCRKDGSNVWLENRISGIRDAAGKLVGLHGVARDVSERRLAQEALKESEERFRTLIEKSTDAIAILDSSGNLLYESPSMERITGYKLEDWIGKPVGDWLLHPDDLAAMAFLLERLLAHPEVASEEVGVRFKHKDSTWHYLEGTVRNLLNDPKVNGLVINYRDVTERVKAEAAVKESEKKFRTLFDSANDGIFIHRLTGSFLEVNDMACRQLGYTREELLRLTPGDIDSPEFAAKVAERTEELVRNGQAVFETAHVTKGGRVVPVEASSRIVDFGGKPAVLTVTRDISERKRAEEALLASEERFRALVEKATDAVAVLDAAGNVLYYTPSMLRVTGYKPGEWVDKSLSDLLLHPDDLPKLVSVLEEVLKAPGASVENFTTRYQHQDGTWHVLEATARNMLHDPKIAGIVANFRDITERVKAEELLRASEERFRGLVETTSDWVWETDRNTRYTYVSPRVRDILGYEPGEILAHTPFQFMHQREGRRVSKIVRRFASAHLPFSLLENTCVHKDGHSVVLETSAVPIIGSDGSFLGYRGIDRDITERKKVEQELQHSLKRLEKTMGSTIEAITNTIETRDPYTTGHQMRVTDLACFIAKVMMVPPTQIEGIRVAGLLHDIGKIAIPTEILSKPGKLNDVEYEMIKTHSKVGYNILKKIEFPWPVARTVLQHHERWNGSGYPHGIRGEDILLEARILAVADVMEAMSSHRPYRPTVGADKALDEITKNSGILYDPAVAKACVTAFTEAGFKFAAAGPGGAGEVQSTSLSHTAEYPEDQ